MHRPPETQTRPNSSLEIGFEHEVLFLAKDITATFSCWKQVSVFSKSVVPDKSTMYQWQVRYTRIFEYYKLSA